MPPFSTDRLASVETHTRPLTGVHFRRDAQNARTRPLPRPFRASLTSAWRADVTSWLSRFTPSLNSSCVFSPRSRSCQAAFPLPSHSPPLVFHQELALDAAATAAEAADEMAAQLGLGKGHNYGIFELDDGRKSPLEPRRVEPGVNIKQSTKASVNQIKEGVLDPMPIWSKATSFRKLYQGMGRHANGSRPRCQTWRLVPISVEPFFGGRDCPWPPGDGCTLREEQGGRPLVVLCITSTRF
jgi:hypothetical protein